MILVCASFVCCGDLACLCFVCRASLVSVVIMIMSWDLNVVCFIVLSVCGSV